MASEDLSRDVNILLEIPFSGGRRIISTSSKSSSVRATYIYIHTYTYTLVKLELRRECVSFFFVSFLNENGLYTTWNYLTLTRFRNIPTRSIHNTDLRKEGKHMKAINVTSISSYEREA